MSFREYISKITGAQTLVQVKQPISRMFEIAGLLKALEPETILFSNVVESPFKVVGNLFTSKSVIADYFNLEINQIIPFLVEALEHPLPPETTSTAACQQVVISDPDLDSLPILMHTEGDGGKYISSGVVIASHPVYGQNLDFHRCMQVSKDSFTVRVVKNRHFDHYLRELNKMDIAVCIGLPPNILLAAATSVQIGLDELGIANALKPFRVVKAKTVDLWVPADSEFVLEGSIHFDRLQLEGPFVDLTGTYDVVREQPVFQVHAITHRENAIWQALLPGGLEHKLLMGLPREPTIFQKVNQVVHCLDVNITPGGASWLHAVVQITKQSESDGKAAIQAAFSGHRSCKHVFVVDGDIDIYDPKEVEWAMATRFQGSRDLVVMPPEQGSSLDPSADLETHFTTKIGFDLTKPLGSSRKNYQKTEFPKIDLEKFLPGSGTL